ncbi:hypothetical protein [Indioceanicola profundi]|uniref:hypothetical protein n=1 Tax=Indioceanicola profundi TaxID=2220096 RepID=UPI000E6AB85F|nr:hypothetical protein [Indioceanicola profundi]
MAEITHAGLWLRWSSLTRRDKRDVLATIVAIAAGILLARLPFRFGIGPGGLLTALSPLAPLLLGSVIYARFVLRQDELFRLCHMVMMVWGAAAMLTALFTLTLLQRVPDLPVNGPLVLGAAFSIGSIAGGVWATRRYL